MPKCNCEEVPEQHFQVEKKINFWCTFDFEVLVNQDLEPTL